VNSFIEEGRFWLLTNVQLPLSKKHCVVIMRHFLFLHPPSLTPRAIIIVIIITFYYYCFVIILYSIFIPSYLSI